MQILTNEQARQTGIGRSVIGLVQGLARVGTETRLVAFCNWDGLRPLLRSQDVVVSTPYPTASPFARTVWQQTALPRQVRQAGVDVLIGCHFTLPLRGVLCPRIVLVYDLSSFPRGRGLSLAIRRAGLRWLIASSSRRAECVLTPARAVAEGLQSMLGLPAHRCQVLPWGGPAPVFKMEHTPPAVPAGFDVPFILWVGLASPRKNLTLTLRAFDLVAARGFPHHLVIVGYRGPDWNVVEATLRTLTHRDRVHLLGYVPDDRLAALYRQASCFVRPFLDEGFGIPVLEAFACRCPVVASSQGSLAEVAGDAALRVDPRDERSIADGICRILDDPREADCLRDRGRERLQQFSWDRAAAFVLDLVRNLTGDVRKRSL